jgi:hypothetical protein
MTKAEELFHRIANELPGAKESKMFGALCIKAPNGKASAMFYKEDMIFKLEGEPLKSALSLDGAKLFDPMGSRPMGGWVQLSFNYADKWPEIAKISFDKVKTLLIANLFLVSINFWRFQLVYRLCIFRSLKHHLFYQNKSRYYPPYITDLTYRHCHPCLNGKIW